MSRISTMNNHESERICPCDFEKSVCEHMREISACKHSPPSFRKIDEIEKSDEEGVDTLLRLISTLDRDPPPESADSAEWDEDDIFVEIADSDTEEFPIVCLPEPMRQMVLEVTNAERVPLALAAAAALGTASAAIGSGLTLKTGPHRKTYANLFILVAAKSGTGKGRAFAQIARPLQEIATAQIQLWQKTTKPMLESRLKIARKAAEALEKKVDKVTPFEHEAIAAQLADRLQEIDDLNRQIKEPLWIVADVTREAMADALSRGTREALASLSPEARGIVDILGGRYTGGSSDEDIYLSAYSVEQFTVHRIGRTATHLSAPCLTVTWFVQPDALRTMFSKDAFTESGLLPRFLTFDSLAEPEFLPETPYTIPPEIPHAWRDLLGVLTEAFHERDGDPLQVELSSKAEEAFRRFENLIIDARRSGGHLADVSSYAARWTENAQRLALVFHAASHGRNAPVEMVSLSTALDALRVIIWFFKQQLLILSTGRQQGKLERASRVEALLSTSQGQELTIRDLERRHNMMRPELVSLVKNFPDRFVIESKKPKGPGRPSEVLRMVGGMN